MILPLAAAAALFDIAFPVRGSGEAVATVTARCERCSWGEPGREAAALTLTVDGRYARHLLLTRGRGPDDYEVALGTLRAGEHRLRIAIDRKWTAREVGAVSATASVAEAADPALALTPILYARPNTVGRFTDAPLLMWYERLPLAGGARLRYSVVFTNEDGGTPIDRLMATWGRTTDIEAVYEADVDAQGRLLADRYQGPDHEVKAFRGHREGRHPLLWVKTDNNMVVDRGRKLPRFAPAARPFDLTGVSREAVMDAEPWTYRVAAEEARREGKVADDGSPGSKRIPDPRRFVYLEGCGEVHDAALAFDVATESSAGLRWSASDGGRPEFRIARSGCFRGAVALPGAETAALRLRAHTRLPRKDEPPLPPGTGTARITSLRLFRLGTDYAPAPPLFIWSGEIALSAKGPPWEHAIAQAAIGASATRWRSRAKAQFWARSARSW
jgi:hypothetical protein